MTSYVRYIERTREFYLSEGYEKPYEWAHFDDVPFTPLKKPLAECRVTLISSSEISIRGRQVVEDESHMGVVGGVYSIPSDTPLSELYSPSHSYDRHATTLEDVNSFFPVSRLQEAVASGRIGSLTRRLHGVFNAYSQRRTRERDAPALLERLREDGADIAVMAPLCPVCHQTNSLVARHLEANGIPTLLFATARDIVEYCGVPRVVFSDFPLGSPCGEPHNTDQQRSIVEFGFKLLEVAFAPRTTVQTPYKWSQGDEWKKTVLTQAQPWKRGEVEDDWNRRKAVYRHLKSEGKV